MGMLLIYVNISGNLKLRKSLSVQRSTEIGKYIKTQEVFWPQDCRIDWKLREIPENRSLSVETVEHKNAGSAHNSWITWNYTKIPRIENNQAKDSDKNNEY